MIGIEKNDGTPRVLGRWDPVILDGKLTAKVTCPDCGLRAYLDDHEISTEGVVDPSVVCDCGFHDYMTLANWDSEYRKDKQVA